MQRLALAALVVLAATLGSSCVVDVSLGDLDIAWNFTRGKLDGSVVTYTCEQAGIDTMEVEFDSVTLTGPCADNAGDGARLLGVPSGFHRVAIRAYRNDAELYSTEADVSVPVLGIGAATASLYGILDDLDIYASFLDLGGQSGWSTCAAAGVATLDWSLKDSHGTTVGTGTASCEDPAGLSFRGTDGIDRDRYYLRILGYASGATVEDFDNATPPGCSVQPFDHFGRNVAAAPRGAWDVNLYDVSTIVPAQRCP